MNRFKRTYIRFYPGLVSYAMKIVRSQAAAEDIVQEVFLKIWNDGESENIKRLDNYLLLSVKNRCIDYLRKQKYMNTISIDTIQDKIDIAGSENNDPAIDDAEVEIITKLYIEINNLPPKCREVFMLVKIQGYTYKQAATYLNISVNMVKKHITKALHHLRNKLIP